MIEPGTVLQERYKVESQIGLGGMGAVYVATDERFGSTVAIKETLCMDENFRKAIDREARLLNSLKHSALPRVTDHFEEQNGQFLVMEYIQGEDVAELLKEQKSPFPPDQVVKWADELLDALDYLHTQEMPVVHRDIKPQNLKINSRGEIVLLDFGLAKGNPNDTGHQTTAKSIFGYSRNYASLEQIQGTGTDPRSDLYSLAATLYHLLTNVAPPDAVTRAMAILSKDSDPLVPANLVNAAVPAGVAGVLQMALNLNAAERPASASEMREMLSDSGSYADLADPATVAAHAAATQAFAQATNLRSDGADDGRQTHIETQLHPSSAPLVTNVGADDDRGAVTNIPLAVTALGEGGKNPFFSVGAIALSIILIGAAIAGGIYVANTSAFGGRQEPGTVDQSSATAPATANLPQNTKVSAAEPVKKPASNSSEHSSPANSETEPPAEQPAETVKNGKAAPSPKQKAKASQDDTADDNPDDPDIPPGGVVVTTRDENGRVTSTRVKPDVRVPRVDFPLPPGFDPSRMDAEQQRRILRAMRKRQNQPRPTPPDLQP